MGTIAPTTPNHLIHLANGLRRAQNIGNKVDAPLIGPLGDVFFKDAQDVAERLSYNEPAYTGTGMTTKLMPGLVDLAGYGASGVGVMQGTIKGGKIALQKLLAKQLKSRGTDMTNLSRREFLKTGALGTAGVAAATSGAGVGARLLEGAAPAVAKAAAVPLVKAVAYGGMEGAADAVVRKLAKAFELGEGVPYDALDVDPGVLAEFNKGFKEDFMRGYKEKDIAPDMEHRMFYAADDTNVPGLATQDEMGNLSELVLSRRQAKASELLAKYDGSGVDPVRHWQITGKWPRGYPNSVMRWADSMEIMEWGMDSHSGVQRWAEPGLNLIRTGE